MTILILEDDAIQRKSLVKIIENYYEKTTILTASDFNTAKDLIIKKHVDIFLLDIRLSDNDISLNGVNFGNYIRSISVYRDTPILFLTSVPEEINYCINTLHCYSYLMKPFTANMIVSAIDDLINKSNLDDSNDYLKLTIENNIKTKLYFRDIYYVMSDKHAITYITNSDTFKSKSYTLSELCSNLPNCFIRCHKSYIINTNYIRNYDKTNRYINFENHSIPVGRQFKNKIDNYFDNGEF